LERAGENEAQKEAARKKAFERNKALAIAQATISGAQAVLSALADPVAGRLKAIAAGIAAAAQIAIIASTRFQGGSGGTSRTAAITPAAEAAGAGAGGASINPVSNTSTILGDQTITVTETDITQTQNNVTVIEDSATF